MGSSDAYRGGSFHIFSSGILRSAIRYDYSPGDRDGLIGFRFSRTK
jgi:formylglycine-generating enzyme required for sulfatase activity